MPRPTARTIIYTAVAASLVGAALVATIVCVRGGKVPDALVNSRVGRSIAARAGVLVTLDSLRVGCLRPGCAAAIDAQGIDVVLDAPEALRVQVGSVQWCAARPLTARAVHVRAGNQPDLASVDSIEAVPDGRVTLRAIQAIVRPDGPLAVVETIDLVDGGRSIVAANVRAPLGPSSALRVGTVKAGPVTPRDPDGWLRIDETSVTGVRVQLRDRADAAETCAQLHSTLASVNDATAPLRSLPDFINRSLGRVGTDLLVAAIVLGAIVFALKLLSLLWLPCKPLRVALALSSALLPFLLYFVLHRALHAVPFLIVAALLIVGVAVVSRLRIYRDGPTRYNRWEPFAADLLAVVVLLPLLGHGIALSFATSMSAGVRLNRLSVSDTTGQYENALTFNVPSVQIGALRAAFPQRGLASAVVVDSVRIPSVAVVVKERGEQPRNLATVGLSDTVVDRVTVNLGANSTDVKDVLLRARLRGTLTTPAFQDELQRIEYLRGLALPTGGVDFAVAVETVGSATTPAAASRFDDSDHAMLDARIQAAILPAECGAKYAASARIRTEPLKAVLRVDGDTTHVFIRELASLPGSDVQIASGSGTVALEQETRADVRLAGITGTAGTAKFALDSARVIAAVPAIGRTGPQRIRTELGGIDLRDTTRANALHIARSAVEFQSAQARQIGVRATLEGIRVVTTSPSSLNAEIPIVETQISGTTTAELIPRTFTGTAAVRLQDAAAPLVATNGPLKVTADIWKGVFQLPSQETILETSLAPRSTTRVPLRLAATTRLASLSPSVSLALDSSVSIASFPIDLGQARLSLRDVAVTAQARTDRHGSDVNVGFATGWNDVEVPAIAGAFCLEQIASFQLTAEGSVARLTTNPPSLSSIPTSIQPCVALPATSTGSFRVSGTWPGSSGPLLQVENRSGAGVRIDGCDCELSKVTIRQGRLESLQATATLLGIRDLHGNGGFGLRNHVALGADSAHVVTTLLGSGGSALVDTAVDASPRLVTFGSIHQFAGTERIVAELKPLLTGFGVDLEGIDLQGRLAKLEGRIGLSQGGVGDVHAEVEIQPGPLASFRLGESLVNLSSQPVQGARPLAVRFDITRPAEAAATARLVATVDVPRLNAEAIGGDGSRSTLRAGLQVMARGALLQSVPEPNRVFERLSEVLNGLRAHAEHAMSTFRPERSGNASLTAVDWNVRVGAASSQEPTLAIGPNQVALRLGESTWNARWQDGGAAERSDVSGSVSAMSNLSAAGDSLLVDAVAPLRLRLAAAGAPPMDVALRLPLQVLVGRHLERSRTAADLLWDDVYYANFWRDHPSAFAGIEIIPLVDGAVTVGNLTVAPLLIPTEGIHVAIGLADTFQLHAPAAARALFGGASGLIQSNVRWSGPKALVDARVHLALDHIQAGAVEASIDGVGLPLVEDEGDGTIEFRSDGFPLDADSTERLLAGRPSDEQLDALGLSVKLTRSPEVADIPATVQMSSDVQVNVLNEILNRLIKDFQLSNPPRLVSYRQLAVDFHMERGRVRSKPAVLALGGLQIFASNAVDVEGQVLVHLAPGGEPVRLRDLIAMLSR